MVVTSLVSIAIGAAMIFNPFESLEALMKVTGVVLLFTQLLNIYDDIYILLAVKDKPVAKVPAVKPVVHTVSASKPVAKKAPVKKATTAKKTTTRKTTKK